MKRGKNAPVGPLRGAVSPNDLAERTATVIEADVPELAVACECGAETRKFPQADVREGRCAWRCHRRRCQPST